MLFASSRLYGVVFCPLQQPCISLWNCCIIFMVVLLRMFYSLSLVTPFSLLNLSSRPVKGRRLFVCRRTFSLKPGQGLFPRGYHLASPAPVGWASLAAPSWVHHQSSIREICTARIQGLLLQSGTSNWDHKLLWWLLSPLSPSCASVAFQIIKYDLGFLKISSIIKDFCSCNELFQKVFSKDTSLNSARVFHSFVLE